MGTLFDAGDVVAAVCHGPAGLVGARRADGRSMLADRRVTGVLRVEEVAVDLVDVVPFLLEDRMRELGARFVGDTPWANNAVRDGNLITGQSQSTAWAARLVLVALVRE